MNIQASLDWKNRKEKRAAQERLFECFKGKPAFKKVLFTPSASCADIDAAKSARIINYGTELTIVEHDDKAFDAICEKVCENYNVIRHQGIFEDFNATDDGYGFVFPDIDSTTSPAHGLWHVWNEGVVAPGGYYACSFALVPRMGNHSKYINMFPVTTRIKKIIDGQRILGNTYRYRLPLISQAYHTLNARYHAEPVFYTDYKDSTPYGIIMFKIHGRRHFNNPYLKLLLNNILAQRQFRSHLLPTKFKIYNTVNKYYLSEGDQECMSLRCEYSDVELERRRNLLYAKNPCNPEGHSLIRFRHPAKGYRPDVLVPEETMTLINWRW